MPNKQNWEKVKNFGQGVLEILSRNNPITKQRIADGWTFIKKSWKSIAILLPLFLLLYYIIGSWATNDIDKNFEFKTVKPKQGLTIVDASANLIKREVDDKMWTPNLPFIFPGYVLDNMPAYQQGIIEAVRNTIKNLSLNYDSADLQKASELLQYPANIWLLSKTENLALAPSSGAQYRKARKALMKFNKEGEEAKEDSQHIATSILKMIEKNLANSSRGLEKQIREYSQDMFDTKADDVFYLIQGRLYGYYVILNALAEDFKSEILETEQYQTWTSLQKTLEGAISLSPTIVRNGEPDDSLTPNHLLALGYYTAKARLQLNKIIESINQK